MTETGAPLELTVLLPTLNEGPHLARVLGGVRAAAAALTASFEILVVDGGSRDQTVAAAQAAGARVERQRGRGYGAAVAEGLELARGRWVLSMDADGSHPASSFSELWERRERSDLVIASRFVAGGSATMPWHRYFLSWCLNTVTRRFLGLPVRDSSSGLRLYRREAVAGLPLAAEDFSVQQEVLVRLLARGGRAEEIPFHYEERLSGESKADIPHLALSYPRMLIALRRIHGGLTAPAAGAAVLALGLACGLWGITWGLPGAARLRAFPEGMQPTPEVAQKLAESWQRLYQGIERTHQELKGEEPVTRVQGVEEVPPGWTWPPDKLLNSYRSLLVRSENPDEQKLFVILSRMRPWRFEFKPLYLHYGGAFIYPLGAFLQTASIARLAHLKPDLRHYLLHPEDMGRLYLLGRVFVLLFQVAGLLVLFDMGRRLSGPWTGLFAAALFCLCPFAVAESHTAKPHPYSAFWVLAGIRYLFLVCEGGARREYLLAGLCLGMAAGANSSFACLAFLPLLAWALRGRERGGWREPLGAMALAGGVYSVTNPYLFLAFRDFLWETTVYPGGVRGFGGNLLSLLGPWASAGLGPILHALGAAALVLALARREPKRRMLALTFVAGFGVLWLFMAKFWGFLDAAALRFFMPLFALTCLLAADLVCSGKAPVWLKVLLLGAALMDSGLRSWVYLENFHRDAGTGSTRVQASDWIEANIPAGATVGLVRYPQPAHTPPFRYDRYHLVVFEKPEDLYPRLPDYLVLDALGLDSLFYLTAGTYSLAASFPSYRLAWAGVGEGNFANTGFFVYRRSGVAAPTREKL